VAEHRSFAACGTDSSMQETFEEALKELLYSARPLYQKVGAAARCLSHLRANEFPNEVAVDVAIIFSVRPYIGGEYPNYWRIPRQIQREWFPAFLRIYRLLMIAKGAESALWPSPQRHDLPVAQATRIERIAEACRGNISDFESYRFRRRGTR